MCFDIERTVITKAAGLGLQPPPYRMCEQPERFASWAERVAHADRLRHAGKPYEHALDDCDRHGCPLVSLKTHAVVGVVRGDGMDMLARAFSDVEDFSAGHVGLGYAPQPVTGEV